MISCHLIGLRKTKTLLRPKKTKAERWWGWCRVESRSKDTHDTIESFRSIDFSTFGTCGKFHLKVVFFIFLYWNYVTHRSSRTISFNQQPCLSTSSHDVGRLISVMQHLFFSHSCASSSFKGAAPKVLWEKVISRRTKSWKATMIRVPWFGRHVENLGDVIIYPVPGAHQIWWAPAANLSTDLPGLASEFLYYSTH